MKVGITERAVQRIVADLEAANYINRTREGRRNHYHIHSELPLRHPIEAHTEIGALIDLILKKKTSPAGRVTASSGAKTRAARQ